MMGSTVYSVSSERHTQCAVNELARLLVPVGFELAIVSRAL